MAGIIISEDIVMATQSDVAKLAKCSFITVSRVVNNKGNVKESTRKRVLEAIKELKYYPSNIGRALNMNKVNTIAIIAPTPTGYTLEDSGYSARILNGIEKACIDNSYDLLLSTQAKDQNYFRLYYERKVDGLIIMGAELTEEQENEIVQDRVPCTVIGSKPKSSKISYVNTDNEEAMYELTEKLIRLGHKKLAFLSVSEYNYNISRRLAGFQRAMQTYGLSTPDKFILKGSFNEQAGREAVKSILEMDEKPTALICSNDSTAIGALLEAKENGIKVPEELSITGFDGLEIGRYTIPSITSVYQPLVDMGYRAAKQLFNRINNPECHREFTLFPVSFVDGDSIAPPQEG